MTAPAAALAPDRARAGIPAHLQRHRGAEALPHGAGDHGLGLAHVAVARVADAADRALGDGPGGRVPLGVLGDALVAPTGAAFDPADAGDVDLLMGLLWSWANRLAKHGLDLRDVGPSGAHLQRAPRRGDDAPVEWARVASRVELARWARRAGPAPQQPARGVVALVRALAPEVSRMAERRAEVAQMRRGELAAGRPWPPEIIEGHRENVFSRTEHRPLVVGNGLAEVVGCALSSDIACVPAEGGAWTCARCGRSTPVPSPVVGPRVPWCECADVVCVHPRNARLAPWRPEVRS